MELIKPRMLVKIIHKGKMVPKYDSEMVWGTVLQLADLGNDRAWWVEFIDKGVRNVEIYYEKDLIDWNYGHLLFKPKVCTCGARAVGSPGHIHKCDLYEKNPYD